MGRAMGGDVREENRQTRNGGEGKGKWKKDDRQVNCNQYTGDYF